MTQSLKAGTAITEISPPKGVSLGGYPHHPRYNKGVHDPLYASCLYINDGSTPVVIVTMDLLMYSKKYVKLVREKASAKTGVPKKNIMISCSHSHSAPRASLNFTMDAMQVGQEPNLEYIENLNTKLINLIIDAVSNPFPAKIGIEKGYCGKEQGVGGNRRDPKGLSDPEVWVIGVQDLEANWRAVLVRYALHPTFLHSDNFMVSADYPGYIRKYLNDKKPGSNFLFAQGTSGNQSSRYFRSGPTFTEAERVGIMIGKEVINVLNKMKISSQLSLIVKSKEIDIELRKLPNKIEAQRRVSKLKAEWDRIKSTKASDRDIWNAELRFLGAEDTLGMVLLQEQGKLNILNDELPVEIQLIGIGDTRIIGIQGELFLEFGLTIQYRAPFTKCFVIELANGVLPGYAATARAYSEGGYETGASLLTGRSGEQLVAAAVQLLYET